MKRCQYWSVYLLLCLMLAASSAYAKEGDVYTVFEGATLRLGPDSFYAPAAKVAKGDVAVELSRSGLWRKVRLSATGDIGWLSLAALTGEKTPGQKSLSAERKLPNKQKLPIKQKAPIKQKQPIKQKLPAEQKLAVKQALPVAPVRVVQKEQAMAPLQQKAVSPMFEDGAISSTLKPAVQAQKNGIQKSEMQKIGMQKARPHRQTKDVATIHAPTRHTEYRLYRFTNKANLRAGPNVKYDTVSWARTGSQAAVLDRKGDWLRIQMRVSKRIGWVYKGSLFGIADDHSARSSSLALLHAGNANVSETKATKTAKTKVAQVKWTQIKGTQVKETQIKDAKQGQLGVEKTAVFDFHATTALKTGAGAAFDVVAWAKEGAKAAELDRKGAWVQVQMQLSKRIGWVSAAALHALPMESAARVIPPQLLSHQTAGKQADKMVLQQTEKIAPPKSVMENKPLMTNKTVVANKNNAAAIKIKVVPVATRKASLPKMKVLAASHAVANADGAVLMQTTMIRKTPGALSDVLGWAGAGTQVEKISQQGKWIKVRMQHSGRIGWIEAGSFQKASIASMPTAKPVDLAVKTAAMNSLDGMQQDVNKTAIAGKATHVAAVHQIGLKQAKVASKSDKDVYTFNKKSNMRAGPNVKFDTVSWAGVGAKAVALARVGDWIRIQMLVSKRIGWVYAKSLDMVSAGVGVAGASLATGLVSIANENKPQLQQSGIQTTARKVQVEKTPAASKIIQTTASHLYRFNKKSNLRAGPGRKYEVVSWAGNAAYAQQLGRKGDWVHVQMQVSKRIGWVFQGSLALVKPVGATAPTMASTTPSAIAASTVMNADKQSEKVKRLGKQLYFFKQTSNLRAGPGKKYERIAWGGRNETAAEIAHQGDWKRVRMTISGKIGWVFHSYLIRALNTDYAVVSPVHNHVTDTVQAHHLYRVIRTEPLRADAGDFSELIGSVQKGDIVAWLEERNGWTRVNPQVDGGNVGWIESKLLKQRVIPKFEYKQALMNKTNMMNYRNRVSKGEVFNFSYAALEEALYKVPVEDIHIRIAKKDLKALFLKRQYDQSPFDIRLKTGRHNLHGTVKVLGSSTRVFKKKSLLIKLDKESGRWYGHRRLALRSMASDKALMREWMAWKMMAAMGMKVPEVHFTRVSFNRGEKTGLYLSIEWMGSEFLEGNGLDKRGEFYQPDDAAHCGDLYATDQDMGLCFSKITPQNADYSNLKAMAVAVNAATDENIDKVLAKYFDVESVINWIAVNALVTNGDTYNKNYWLYFHPTKHKWTMIPWDYNLTFGRTYDQYAVKAFRIFNDNFQYYYPPDVGAGNPIKDKALRNPRLRARLEARIKHLTGMEAHGSEHTFGWFSPTVMQARIGNLTSVVGKEVYKDTFLSYGEGDFTKTYESLIHYVTSHDYFLKTKLFGDFPWNPEPPNQPFIPMRLPDQLIASGQIHAGGESLHLVDHGWGYFVADVKLDKPLQSKVQFDVRIEGGITPKYLPTGQPPRRCIERSWMFEMKTKHVPVTADLMFEYTQENSRRSEVPPMVHEELLTLWMLDGERWKPIQTEVNEYSNTLKGKNVRMKSHHKYRFVACSPF